VRATCYRGDGNNRGRQRTAIFFVFMILEAFSLGVMAFTAASAGAPDTAASLAMVSRVAEEASQAAALPEVGNGEKPIHGRGAPADRRRDRDDRADHDRGPRHHGNPGARATGCMARNEQCVVVPEQEREL
jgi:hypothetical protein